MLAKRRALLLNGQEIERTPLLIPSFSSKGFPDIKGIIEFSAELIDDVTLVSAYDLHYENIDPPFDFAALIFLDSGGYEASKDAELSDYGDKDHSPRPWSQEMHEAQIAKWKARVPSVLISYDHPKERLPVRAQIERANAMAPGQDGFLREILIKPETIDQRFLQMPAIIQNVRRFSEFDIIGVTEKELGNSVLVRMRNIMKLRRALESAGLETPIHVFGSLDTVTTPMYFLAGADIFDGLTWLRFAFDAGRTVYKHDFGALKLGVGIKKHVIDGLCWNSNYRYIKELESEMRRFLNEGDFSRFKHHGILFREALESAMEAEGV